MKLSLYLEKMIIYSISIIIRIQNPNKWVQNYEITWDDEESIYYMIRLQYKLFDRYWKERNKTLFLFFRLFDFLDSSGPQDLSNLPFRIDNNRPISQLRREANQRFRSLDRL